MLRALGKTCFAAAYSAVHAPPLCTGPFVACYHRVVEDFRRSSKTSIPSMLISTAMLERHERPDTLPDLVLGHIFPRPNGLCCTSREAHGAIPLILCGSAHEYVSGRTGGTSLTELWTKRGRHGLSGSP